MVRLDTQTCFIGLLLLSACSVAYSPYPLDLDHKLPADAFSRCRAVLLNSYEILEYSDPEGFRLETAWQPITDPPGERRATVYRDLSRSDSLAIIVELRRLTVPLFGMPHWTSVRGDDGAERRLARLLRESLADVAEAPGFDDGEQQRINQSEALKQRPAPF